MRTGDPLEELCKIFGWQGGTIHEAIDKVQQIKKELADAKAKIARLIGSLEIQDRTLHAWEDSQNEVNRLKDTVNKLKLGDDICRHAVFDKLNDMLNTRDAQITELKDSNRALNEAATQSVDTCQRMTKCVRAADTMRTLVIIDSLIGRQYDEKRNKETT